MFRACVVCQSCDHVRSYCDMKGYRYLKCGFCGLVYIDELEQTDKIYKAYSGGLLKSLRRKLISPFRRFHHDRSFGQSTARAETIFGFAAKQVNSVGKYLDIGCNKCYLLAQGIKQGWDVYGCELVPELSAPFRNSYKQYRDHVYCGRFADIRLKFENNTFELITAVDVIEHFEDVVADMRGVYDLLKVGGAFVIQTPDAGCEQAKRGGCHWGALKPLEHLHLFNQKSLDLLARRVGFRDVQFTPKPFEDADGNFVAVLRK